MKSLQGFLFLQCSLLQVWPGQHGRRGGFLPGPEKAAFYNSYPGTVCAELVLSIAADLVSWNRGQVQIFLKSSFVERQFIYPIIPPFKVCDSVVSRGFTEL